MSERITKSKLTGLLRDGKTIIDRIGQRSVTIEKWGYRARGLYEGGHPRRRDPFRIDMDLSGIQEGGLNLNIKYDNKLVFSVSEHEPDEGNIEKMQILEGVYIVEYLSGKWEQKLKEIKEESKAHEAWERSLIKPSRKL